MSDALAMVMPGLVDRGQGGAMQLLGSVCPQCNHYAYPSAESCSECGSEMQITGLGCSGTIYSHTTVRVKPPLGLPRPYSCAYIDLDDAPLRIYGLLDSTGDRSYSTGDQVELQVAELGVNSQGEPCLRPFFSLCSSQDFKQD